MHLFQLEIITVNFHAFYITKNSTLLCDATMTLIRQDKIEYKSLFPQKVHGSPNFDKAACTTIYNGCLHWTKTLMHAKLYNSKMRNNLTIVFDITISDAEVKLSFS